MSNFRNLSSRRRILIITPRLIARQAAIVPPDDMISVIKKVSLGFLCSAIVVGTCVLWIKLAIIDVGFKSLDVVLFMVHSLHAARQ